jgi:hypothetical protein
MYYMYSLGTLARYTAVLEYCITKTLGPKPPPAWDFGLWTRGFCPPWTLDFMILTPLDFVLQGFDPSDFGLRLSELSVGLHGSPGGSCHIITFTPVFIQIQHVNSSTRVSNV